jgi:hypothetical protein
MNRNLSPNVAKGMFGGPRGKKGNYLTANQGLTSGKSEDVYSHSSSVNGNIETRRRPVKGKRAKKV